jgi:hypothetical protein
MPTSMSFAAIESSIVDFGKRAQAGKLSMDELTGGTFSITNGGIFGSLLSTPILNPPQSAILGMHKIQERPMVENGEVVVRPMMYLALSYDHRIIDGKRGGQLPGRHQGAARGSGTAAAGDLNQVAGPQAAAPLCQSGQAPQGASMAKAFDVIVIGGGPGRVRGGDPLRAAGPEPPPWWTSSCTRTASPALGGTCLNVGCIPSKALLDSSEQYTRSIMSWKRTASRPGGRAGRGR